MSWKNPQSVPLRGQSGLPSSASPALRIAFRRNGHEAPAGPASGVPGRRWRRPGKTVRGHLFVYRPHPPPSARVKPGAPQPRSLRRSAAIFPPPPFSADANRQLPPHLSVPFPHGTPDPNRPPPLNGRRGRGWERAQRKSGRPKAAAAPPQRAPPSRRGAGPAAALPGRRCPAAPGKEPPGQRAVGGGSGPAAPHTHTDTHAEWPPPPRPPRRRAPYRAGGGGDLLRAGVLAAAGGPHGRGPGRERALRGSGRRRGHGAGRGRARDRNKPRGAERAGEGEGARLT